MTNASCELIHLILMSTWVPILLSKLSNCSICYSPTIPFQYNYTFSILMHLQNEPWCYHKTPELSLYQVDAVMPTKLGTQVHAFWPCYCKSYLIVVQMTLKVNGSTSSEFGELISPLTVDITMESDERLHVKIYDPNKQRWEIPTK